MYIPVFTKGLMTSISNLYEYNMEKPKMKIQLHFYRKISSKCLVFVSITNSITFYIYMLNSNSNFVNSLYSSL